MVLSIDDELPWDPLWAYVLGEGDDHYAKPPSSTKKRTSQSSKEGGFLSYINDIIPEAESRDDERRPPSIREKQEVKRSDSPPKRGSFGSTSQAKRDSFGSTGQANRGSFGSTGQAKRGNVGFKDEASNKTRGFWGRSKRESSSEATESRESWEWRLDFNNSDEEESNVDMSQKRMDATQKKVGIPQKKVDIPQKKVAVRKTESFSKSKSVEKVKTTEKPTKSPTLSAFSCEPWDWELDLATDPVLGSKDSKASSKSIEPSSSQSRKDRRKMKVEVKKQAQAEKKAARRQKEAVSSNESWDWQLGPSVTGSTNDSKKGRRGLWRNNKEKDNTEAWDWSLSNQDVKKEPRKVRFARNQERNDESNWVDPDEVAAQIQLSQNVLLDWVGLNKSTSSSDTFDDDDETSSDRMAASNAKPVQSKVPSTRRPKSGRRGINSTSEPGAFVFGSIFSKWGDLSSEEDESTLNSLSTLDSSAVSTEDFSEDGTRTTQQSDLSSVLAREPVQTEVNEVRLAYQPTEHDKNLANLLPIITEDGSFEETHLYSDERSGSGSERTQKLRGAGSPDRPTLANAIGNNVPVTPRYPRIGSFNSILEGVESAASKVDHDESSNMGALSRDNDELPQQVPRTRGRGVGVCRSLNTLSEDQMRWTRQTGVPFHELSREELSQIFPKVRSISDGERHARSASLPDAMSRSGSAHFQASLDSSGPQSLFEYEYETGVHMFVSYDSVGVGVDGLTVKTAQTPSLLKSTNARKHSAREVLLQVEASTVSRTDCYVRQGIWQKQPEPPIPNTPGVDVIGRICRLDAEAKKRHGLSVGDRVMSLVKWGGNSRYLSIDPSTVVRVPDSVDPAMAVCLAETYLSAFQVLHFKQGSNLRYQNTSLKGKTVLIVGNAATNMGRAISQLASAAGAMQVFAMAKLKYFEQLSQLGIGPLNQDSSQSWEDLTGVIDLIISIDVEIVETYRKLLSGKGRIASLVNGVKETEADCGRKARLPCRGQGRQLQRKLSFFDIYDEWETNIDRCKLDMEHLIRLLDDNVVEPSILDRVALHKVARAQSIVESKRLSGFIVCEPWLVAKSRAIRL